MSLYHLHHNLPKAAISVVHCIDKISDLIDLCYYFFIFCKYITSSACLPTSLLRMNRS